MGFGHCTICKELITGWHGPVVVAEVKDDEPESFAHAQCWVDSGRAVIGPEEIRQMLGSAALPVFEESESDHVRDAVDANR